MTISAVIFVFYNFFDANGELNKNRKVNTYFCVESQYKNYYSRIIIMRSSTRNHCKLGQWSFNSNDHDLSIPGHFLLFKLLVRFLNILFQFYRFPSVWLNKSSQKRYLIRIHWSNGKAKVRCINACENIATWAVSIFPWMVMIPLLENKIYGTILRKTKAAGIFRIRSVSNFLISLMNTLTNLYSVYYNIQHIHENLLVYFIEYLY